ncbi:MAG TPA: T9SS type A sorting domain-containing protein [Ignavibacteria bacterium]|nr:T9SS type A sorting domain-containing protein [Ignavibacteria bacterium]
MAKIKFDIPQTISTKVAVYDILGNEVATVVNETLKPGEYEIDFDTKGLPPGTYFYKLVINGFSKTKKMILIK